jgi:hypothetical protein
MRTMHKFELQFPSFTSLPTSLANLTRRLDMQIRAALQAQDDLNETRRLAGLSPVEAFVVVGEDREAAPSSVPAAAVDLAAKIIAAGRKARGLEPVEKPAEGSLAAKIIAAAAKARGENDEVEYRPAH